MAISTRSRSNNVLAWEGGFF